MLTRMMTEIRMSDTRRTAISLVDSNFVGNVSNGLSAMAIDLYMEKES